MTQNGQYKNAVLDDKELQAGLKQINPRFGDFVTRVAGEVWGRPLIDQKTKALITIALDIANQDQKGPGNPFGAHIDMALKQGATRAEIEELLVFLCVYTGFNKVAGGFGEMNEFFRQRGVEQSPVSMKRVDYSIRDRQGKVVFYVLLWKRKGITLELFDQYWKDVHGPLCARLPGQHQYWQFHLAPNQGGLWSNIESICPEEDQFHGIAELTFETESDRQTFFNSAGLLMDDEHNLFSKAIGYNTSLGNSTTYIDGIEKGNPNGELGIPKFHVMLRKADGVSVETFRKYLTDSFAPAVVKNDSVLKFRLHLFDALDDSRPDAPGVAHSEPPEKHYQAAFEIAFSNHLEMEKFFSSKEYAQAVKDQAKYVKQLFPFPERTAYTFVENSQITLAGQRSSKVADLITNIGATNQLKEDIVSLMNGKQNGKSTLSQYLQGVQHFGITVDDLPKAVEFYVEVLGGKLAIGGDGFIGEDLHNLLFQQEDLEAIRLGVDPKTLGVPNIRDGSEESLDVRFISFGNTCVEVIHFRDAALTSSAPNVFEKVRSSVGYSNVPHISFHVKDNVDLNEFAKMLEDECHRRGMTNVVANKIIHANSEDEKEKLGLQYAKTKFPPGDFDGWALFYCKGPNGEQLEFNQVTRTARQNFKRAQKEYNQETGTNFPWASDTITSQQESSMQTATRQPQKSSSERLPGEMTNLVKEMFKAGESMNIENFVKFYTDDALYQFGNFPVVYGPDGIRNSSQGFLEKVEQLYHHIKNMWEVGDTVICEMEVTYIRYDGKVFSLPCCDTIKIKGDKVQELRIYMDITPVFAD